MLFAVSYSFSPLDPPWVSKVDFWSFWHISLLLCCSCRHVLSVSCLFSDISSASTHRSCFSSPVPVLPGPLCAALSFTALVALFSSSPFRSFCFRSISTTTGSQYSGIQTCLLPSHLSLFFFCASPFFECCLSSSVFPLFTTFFHYFASLLYQAYIHYSTNMVESQYSELFASFLFFLFFLLLLCLLLVSLVLASSSLSSLSFIHYFCCFSLRRISTTTESQYSEG